MEVGASPLRGIMFPLDGIMPESGRFLGRQDPLDTVPLSIQMIYKLYAPTASGIEGSSFIASWIFSWG